MFIAAGKLVSAPVHNCTIACERKPPVGAKRDWVPAGRWLGYLRWDSVLVWHSSTVLTHNSSLDITRPTALMIFGKLISSHMEKSLTFGAVPK